MKSAKKCNATKISRLKIFSFIVGIVICATLVRTFWENESPDVEEKKTKGKSQITEIRPHISKKANPSKTENQLPPSTTNITRGRKSPEKPANASSPWANKPMRVIKPRKTDTKPRRFVYDAEEEIAALLEIEPGTPMFGELPYTHFQKKFQQAIMQKIKIDDSDDEYTKELKKQVQAVKDDLKQLMLDGGDVAAEMRNARNELKELGRYRNSLMQELHELRKSGNYTSQNMKDFETAANKMLEEKGLKPLKVPAVLIRNMELKERKNK